MIVIENHGSLIVATNYWQSEMAQAGKRYVSCNAGAIRILMPATLRPEINEMRTAKVVIVSRGPWPVAGIDEAVEFLFDDGTDSPFALTLTSSSFEFILPAEPKPGEEWTLTVWDEKKGRPHKALERRCHWRRVEKIPCLKPWDES